MRYIDTTTHIIFSFYYFSLFGDFHRRRYYPLWEVPLWEVPLYKCAGPRPCEEVRALKKY